MVPSRKIVSIDELRNCAAAVIERLGHPREHARMIAELLVDSELRGYPDHGIPVLALFPLLVKAGRHNPRPAIRIVSETESALLLDGDRGFGAMPGMEAMRWCIERAQANHGIACATVRNAGSANALAPYVERAAREGLIGFACVNAEPNVAPPGTLTKTFGTNPLAYGVPAGRHYPLVLDMATSGTASLKIRMAALRGEQVPEGLIADVAGRPTTDPTEYWPLDAPMRVGSMLPLGWPQGAHKGFGLAMMVDVLAGVLAGGAFADEASVVESDAGQFYWALDVRAFMPLEEFRARIDEQIDRVKASQRIEGTGEIMVPGERGQRRREELEARGTMPLDEESWQALEGACQATGVEVPKIV